MKKIEEFDVVIIGGGPAGMSALLWSSELGLRAVLLEKEVEFGGQLLHTYNQITNYPGVGFFERPGISR
jgi:thioredoxin reductase (NADPH)